VATTDRHGFLFAVYVASVSPLKRRWLKRRSHNETCWMNIDRV